MSRDTGMRGASGSLKPGVIAVVVEEAHYGLFDGDLVEGQGHDDNCYFRRISSSRDVVRRRRMEVMWALRITSLFPAHYIFLMCLNSGIETD